MSTTATDTTHGADLRRKSSAVVGTEETRNVVDITQLNQEDAALAAQFGYTPVLSNSISLRFPLSFQPFHIRGCSPHTIPCNNVHPSQSNNPEATIQSNTPDYSEIPCDNPLPEQQT